MRQRIAAEHGYVLTRRPYRESSLLIEAFTREHGRVGLVARASRGAKSRTGAVLQPFMPLLLSWSEAGDLGTLADAEASGGAVPLLGERIFHGWYVNELLLKLLQRHDAHPRLYEAYCLTLDELAGDDTEPALRNFELSLLGELGYGLELADDLQPGQRYDYDAERGLRELPAQMAATAGVSGAALIALRDGALAAASAAARREVKALLRAAIQRQLGGRELETPRLLRALRAKLAAAKPPSQP